MSLVFQPLIISISMLFIIGIHGDCVYPEWKKTCQKHCMDNQLSEIQFNQCYGNHFKCQCNGKDLTNDIESHFQTTHLPSTSNSSVGQSTTMNNQEKNESSLCLANSNCTNGQTICFTKYSFCQCENEKWISKLCPVGQICKTSTTNILCRSAAADTDAQASASSICSFVANKCFSFIIFIFLIFIQN